jgi:hypothetical protein
MLHENTNYWFYWYLRFFKANHQQSSAEKTARIIKRRGLSIAKVILIGDKSHEEITQIFKRVKVFISSDTQTAYSRLAALCECESIIVPDEGQSKNDWKPLIKQRYGLLFGFDDYYTNNSFQYDLLLTQIQLGENEFESNVKKFIVESQQYFTEIN